MTLRIGLLECDHVDEPSIGIAGDYADMFDVMLASTGSRVDLAPYDVCRGVLPKSPHECDAWLATGSRHSVYEAIDWIGALSEFVREVQVAGAAYVGICFGHQLLAHSLGGRTERAAVGWGVGAHEMEVPATAAWMDPAKPSATLLYMHQDQVSALPSGGVVLGGTDHCPVAMLQVGSTLLGVQAHPEFPPAYVERLLEQRVDRIGAERTAEARRSLPLATDADVVAQWIVRFFEEVR